MDYFACQPKITESIRSDAVNLILIFSLKNKFHICTVHQAVILMDRFLSLVEILENDLDAIALSCLYLAVKFEEDEDLITVEDLVQQLNNKYNTEYFLDKENIILQQLNFQICDCTMREYLKSACQRNNINVDNYVFSLYISVLLLKTIDYRFVDPKELAEKIGEFCLILAMSDKIIEELIINNPVHSHIYLLWKESFESESCIVRKYFAKEIFHFASLRSIPIITCPHNNLSFLPRYQCIVNSNTIVQKKSIYPKETNFLRIGNLGKGTYGSVEHVKISNKYFALKIIDTQNLDKTIDGNVLRELYSLTNLDHPNIIKVDGFWYNHQKSRTYIILELMQMTLHKKILNYTISEKAKALYIIELLEGLEHIHSKNVIHRDFSTSNILISNDDHIKISDFGLSIYFRHPNYLISYNTNVCTLYFRAVELLLDKVMYTTAIDIWSCACVIFFILTGRYLFVGYDKYSMLCSIFKILGTPDKLYDNSLSNYPKYQRKGFSNRENRYFDQMNILYKMLEYDPVKRINATQAIGLFKKSYEHLL
jgi:tRNA A-37 threonylcarbamoyl transferase component Bud32